MPKNLLRYALILYFITSFVVSATSPVIENDDWEPIEKLFDDVPMMLVPSGCFLMGATEEANQTHDEIALDMPQHEICLDRSFWIDKFEVYQSQFKNLNAGQDHPSLFLGDNLLVNYISWAEANKFCELRGGRLPTEPEWEYAARGPDSLIFPWGNTFNENYVVWDRREGLLGPLDVGSIPEGKSWVGALDMSGNVSEWTYSTLGTFNYVTRRSHIDYHYPYIPTDGREDGEYGRNILKVDRGGSWNDSQNALLSPSQSEIHRLTTHYRKPLSSGNDALSRLAMLGFRCMREYAEGDLPQ